MTTTQSTTSPSTRHVPGFELTLTILGAVCSAVVTGVLAAEQMSTTWKLVGAALGAALPPLVGAVGPGHPLRVTVAVVLTGVAVAVGYGGDQLVSPLVGKETSLPSPGDLVGAEPEPTPEPDPGPGPDDPIVMTEGPLQITISPGSVTCDADGRCDTVTVTSTGTATLHVTYHEFEGDADTYLTAAGCEDTRLDQGESCTITLTLLSDDAPETVATRLVIHQNFQGPASYVPLTAAGNPAALPNLALGVASCDLSQLTPDPDGGLSGPVIVEAPLTATELTEGIPVEAAVYVDGNFQWWADVDLVGERVRAEEFYSGPSPSEVAVVIDPNGLFEGDSPEGDKAICP